MYSKPHHSTPYGSVVASELTEHLDSISDIIRALPKGHLIELFKKYKRKGKYFE